MTNYYFYRCTDPTKLPAYDFYDYANGAVGYKNKLMPEIAQNLGIRYLGQFTDKELEERLKGGTRPKRPVKTHYNGEGHRF